MRVNICNVAVDNCSFNEAVDKIIFQVKNTSSPKYVVTPNAHHIVMLQRDSFFREIYRNAFLSVPDGVSLLWAANFLGTPLKERINGTDLFEQLCAVAADKNLKVFLLGGRPGAAENAKYVMQSRYPGLNVVGTYCPPYGFEKKTHELNSISSQISKADPHLLFVGLGAPKQEKWMYEHYEKLNVPVSLGIGVSFELVSNMVRRAPVSMQRLGLEWLFRLVMEPKRLWQRYVIGNPYFIWLVIRQKLRFSRSSEDNYKCV